MLSKKIVDDLKDSQGKKVLVRRGFSAPLKGGVIQSYNRTNDAIPTIKELLDQGTRVILCSHLGKPKGEPLSEVSLTPVAPALSERFGVEVKFVSDPVVTGAEAQKLAAELKNGEVLLLENTCHRVEEIKYGKGERTEDYVEELATLCDNGVFVNDAFGAAHRAYYSNVGVTKYTKENVVGYLTEKRTKLPGEAVENLVHPFMVVLGGAKVSDKINVINNLLDKVSTLITDGGMAYTSAKAQGQEIDNSLCEEDKLDYALGTVKKAEAKGMKLLLPVDHVEDKGFSNDTEHKVVEIIDAGQSGSDIGPKTIELYKKTLEGAKTVVWNRPMGASEFSNFIKETLEICHAVAELEDAIIVIDSGDSMNAVKKLGFADKMTHISIGGGASLEFLEDKELPDVAAVDNHQLIDCKET